MLQRNELTNVVVDLFTVALLLILRISNNKKRIYQTMDQKIYNFLLEITILITLVDCFSWIIDGKQLYNMITVNLITNAVLYSLAPALGLVWVIYVDFKIFNNERKLRERCFFYSIPFILSMIVCIITIFIPIYFYVDENNVFIRNSPYAYIPFILGLVYAVYSNIILIIHRKRLPKGNYFPLLMYMAIPIICTIIQLISYGLALIYCGYALSMVIIYTKVQNDINVTDYLTGLSNRRHLELYIKTECSHIKDDELLYGVMIDVDNFKKINDDYGHIVGDHALESFGLILRKGFRENDFIARYAGDEFVVIIKLKKNENIIDLINNLNNEKDIFNLTSDFLFNLEYSYGYTQYNNNEKYEDFLNRMDKNMYIEKAKKIK